MAGEASQLVSLVVSRDQLTVLIRGMANTATTSQDHDLLAALRDMAEQYDAREKDGTPYEVVERVLSDFLTHLEELEVTRTKEGKGRFVKFDDIQSCLRKTLNWEE